MIIGSSGCDGSWLVSVWRFIITSQRSMRSLPLSSCRRRDSPSMFSHKHKGTPNFLPYDRILSVSTGDAFGFHRRRMFEHW